MSSTKYLYVAILKDATDCQFGMAEALLLHFGVAADRASFANGRVYRILEADAIAAGISALCLHPLVRHEPIATAADLANAWEPVRRAFARGEETSKPEKVFGPWRVVIEDRRSGERATHDDRPTAPALALTLYGASVEQYVYAHGPVLNWQPRRTEGAHYIVTLCGPAGPLP